MDPGSTPYREDDKRDLNSPRCEASKFPDPELGPYDCLAIAQQLLSHVLKPIACLSLAAAYSRRTCPADALPACPYDCLARFSYKN